MRITDEMIRRWHDAVAPEMAQVGPPVSALAGTMIVAVTFWSSGHHYVRHDIRGDVSFDRDGSGRDFAKLLRDIADALDPDVVEDTGVRHS